MEIKTEPIDYKFAQIESNTDIKTEPSYEPTVKIEPPSNLTVKTEPLENAVIKSEISDNSEISEEFTEPHQNQPIRQLQNQPVRPLQNEPYIWPSLRENATKKYMCRMCLKMCNSQHSFQMHVRKHKPKCDQCEVSFKSWKNFGKHIPYCTRRFGVTHVPQKAPKANVPKLPFKCQLCRRKYEKNEHLIDHQINRCKKRYVADAWIVKI